MTMMGHVMEMDDNDIISNGTRPRTDHAWHVTSRRANKLLSPAGTNRVNNNNKMVSQYPHLYRAHVQLPVRAVFPDADPAAASRPALWCASCPSRQRRPGGRQPKLEYPQLPPATPPPAVSAASYRSLKASTGRPAAIVPQFTARGAALPAGGAHYKYILRTFCSGLLSAAELAFLPLLFFVWLTTRLICLPRKADGGSPFRKFCSHLREEETNNSQRPTSSHRFTIFQYTNHQTRPT